MTTEDDDDGLKAFGLDAAGRIAHVAPPAPAADAPDPGDITIYVDDVRGDDSNPGTFELPVKTFAAANRVAPAVVRGSLRIQLAAGAYTLEDGKKRTHGKRRRR